MYIIIKLNKTLFPTTSSCASLNISKLQPHSGHFPLSLITMKKLTQILKLTQIANCFRFLPKKRNFSHSLSKTFSYSISLTWWTSTHRWWLLLTRYFFIYFRNWKKVSKLSLKPNRCFHAKRAKTLKTLFRIWPKLNRKFLKKLNKNNIKQMTLWHPNSLEITITDIDLPFLRLFPIHFIRREILTLVLNSLILPQERRKQMEIWWTSVWQFVIRRVNGSTRPKKGHLSLKEK